MENDIIKIGVRGRITIPKHVRDKCDIKHMDAYKIHVVGGVLILERMNKRQIDKNTRSLESYFSL